MLLFPLLLVSLTNSHALPAEPKPWEAKGLHNRHMADTLEDWAKRWPAAERPAEEAVRKVQVACVKITVRFAGQETGGSGFFVTDDGVLLTNEHVVRQFAASDDKKKSLRVLPAGSSNWLDAQVVAYHVDYDLALIRIKENREKRPVVKLADQCPEGEKVFCIGCPPSHYTAEGNGQTYRGSHKVTGPDGKEIELLWKTFHYSQGKIETIAKQKKETPFGSCLHTAWTYWGHSGSPLCNFNGEVVSVHNSWNGVRGERHSIALPRLRAFLEERLSGTFGKGK